MNKQYIFGEVKKIDDKIVVVASDETLDRYGEIIQASGWDLEKFMKHSPMLVNHDSRVESLVGKWVDVSVKDKQLIMTPKWADTMKAQEAKYLVENGFLPTVSVGFIVKGRDPENNNVITEAELLEVSWVTIPANPNAMIKMREKGYTFDIKKLEDDTKDNKKGKKEIEPEKKDLETELTKSKKLVTHYRGIVPEYRTLLKTLQTMLGIAIPEGEKVEEINQITTIVKQLSEKSEIIFSPEEENLSKDIEDLETRDIVNMVKDITKDEVKRVSDKYGLK